MNWGNLLQLYVDIMPSSFIRATAAVTVGHRGAKMTSTEDRIKHVGLLVEKSLELRRASFSERYVYRYAEYNDVCVAIQ
jgi:hypothetical protein